MMKFCIKIRSRLGQLHLNFHTSLTELWPSIYGLICLCIENISRQGMMHAYSCSFVFFLTVYKMTCMQNSNSLGLHGHVPKMLR